MIAGLVMLLVFGVLFWAVFFHFKWLAFSIPWAFLAAFFVAHLGLIFLIGLRFVTPYTMNARVVQHTIQLIPRLPQPTLVTAVLVQPDVPVKKGDPLFLFDRRPYEIQVRLLRAKLAEATQNVSVLKADTEVAAQKLAKARSELEYAQYQHDLSSGLAKTGAGPQEESKRWIAQLGVANASVVEARAELARANARYESQIDGVNTSVAEAQAELDQALFYLDNTTMVAPEDGRIVNLQVRPGMVAGIVRLGAIASLICDADRYLLAPYFQEVLKYVDAGQPVEVALDLYPGQIFRGKVRTIWRASGAGQMLPSGSLPKFDPAPPDLPQGQFAVLIDLDGADQGRFPIGALGAAAIYTGGGGFAVLRRIDIRTYSWLNFLYPIPF